MKILGIETSCDETAAAVVEGVAIDRKVVILSQAVASSQEFHQKTGGIVPEVAARKQIEVLLPVLSEALNGIDPQYIDAIAVTIGPGLSGSLLVGVETAKVLALVWGKPLLAVNHLAAHLYANWIGVKSKSEARNSKQFRNLKSQNTNTKIPEFPALGLVVSGGHTDLVLMHSHKDIEQLGSTRDDAAGEAFDKIARMLGLAYPGGPAIAAAAEKFELPSKGATPKVGQAGRRNSKFEISLPRPMIDSEDYDYSFSGLKTAVMRQLSNRKLSGQLVQAIAQEAQEAICEVLATKLMRAVYEFRPKSVLVAGGVAANRRLRQRLKFEIRNSKFEVALFIPPIALCTDNAAYVAASAFYRFSPTPWIRVAIDPGLTITS